VRCIYFVSDKCYKLVILCNRCDIYWSLSVFVIVSNLRNKSSVHNITCSGYISREVSVCPSTAISLIVPAHCCSWMWQSLAISWRRKTSSCIGILSRLNTLPTCFTVTVTLAHQTSPSFLRYLLLSYSSNGNQCTVLNVLWCNCVRLGSFTCSVVYMILVGELNNSAVAESIFW